MYENFVLRIKINNKNWKTLLEVLSFLGQAFLKVYLFIYSTRERQRNSDIAPQTRSWYHYLPSASASLVHGYIPKVLSLVHGWELVTFPYRSVSKSIEHYMASPPSPNVLI